jgi:DNA-binding transcriptional ArsR family regulator
MSEQAASHVSGLDPRFLEDVALVIKTLGHPDRLRIIECIQFEDMKVKDIQQALSLPQAVTSQHLRQMFHLGIVNSRREGKNVLYGIGNPIVMRLLHCLEATQKALMEGNE